MKRAVFVCLFATGISFAQPVVFEAASVKMNNTGDPASHWNIRPGGISVYNMSIKNIVKAAYGIQDVQFSGAAWLDDERYNIEAKGDSKANPKQLIAMLQNLLAERFKVAIHREQRMVSGYVLVVAKSGLKIKPVDTSEGSNERSSGNKFTATHLDMARFAKFLERTVGQPVIDDTHLTGGFDFVLEYALERQQRAADPDSGAPPLPSIFTVIAEQLGLKLEPRKLPVEVIVVDHAERPSDN